MSKLSILFALSGSEQSKFAAEVAWQVAERCQGEVKAMHVVDSQTLWDLLRNDKPGFVGSGLYVNVYEDLTKKLRELGTKLVAKYEAMAGDNDIAGESIVRDGNPVSLLAREAKRHDLVVMGHQPRSSEKRRERTHYLRYAVAEGLAHECPRALMIVQDRVVAWKSMTILLSTDHVNLNFLNACMDFAEALRLEPNIVVLASGSHEESPEDFMADLKKANNRLKEVKTEVFKIEGVTTDDMLSPFHAAQVELDWVPDPDTLLVIPTRRSGGERLTVFDTSPDLFVRNLTLPWILMWPEEHVELVSSEENMIGAAGI